MRNRIVLEAMVVALCVLTAGVIALGNAASWSVSVGAAQAANVGRVWVVLAMAFYLAWRLERLFVRRSIPRRARHG